MRHLLIAATLFAASCATAPTPGVTAAPVIAAERAFTADAAARGWIPAFRAFVAPDGVILHPDPVNAAAFYGATPDDGDRTLAWWPEYAGIARSGDFGFTTGPVTLGADPRVPLHYFTVWRRQPDGAWKWIFDCGIGVTDATPFPRAATNVPMLAVATGGAGSPAAAVTQVEAIERVQATPDAIVPLLAENVRVNRAGLAPGVGRAQATALLAQPTRPITLTPLRREASAAGDLVLSICNAAWSEDGVARRGLTVRIWQWQSGGWRVVYDELVPVRTPGTG